MNARALHVVTPPAVSYRSKQWPLIHARFALLVSLLVFFLLTWLPDICLAQYPPYPPYQNPPTCMFGVGIGHHPIAESIPVKTIGGTAFPWVGRTGNTVTINGYVVLVGYYTQTTANVTVKFHGQDCQVTPDPYDPHTATWQYVGNPISVGSGPSVAIWDTQAFYNGTEMNFVNTGLPAEYTFHFHVYKVVQGANSDGNADNVITTNSLFFDGDGTNAGLFSSDRIPNGDASQRLFTRLIQCGADLTAPSAANHDFSGLTVGIIQTLSEDSSKGPMSYWRLQDVGLLFPTLGTRHLGYSLAPPLWDGANDNLAPFYSAQAMVVCQAGTSDQYHIGSLKLVDMPYLGLINEQDNQNADYWWGDGWLYPKSLGGTPRVDDFEDVLSATSSDCPGIYIRVDGFHKWRVTFSGSLQMIMNDQVWSGGSVAQTGESVNDPVSDTSHGSVNTKSTDTFTVP